jgi:NAD(P)-dependent dehydrogenase (short-subunit alcohol dehydrogenase family)
MRLGGRTALITGAQQGIGAAIAVALAKEGADVTITWLDDEPAAEAVAGRIRHAGRRAHLIRADVERLTDIDAMVAETARVLGAADILVNKLGFGVAVARLGGVGRAGRDRVDADVVRREFERHGSTVGPTCHEPEPQPTALLAHSDGRSSELSFYCRIYNRLSCRAHQQKQ